MEDQSRCFQSSSAKGCMSRVETVAEEFINACICRGERSGRSPTHVCDEDVSKMCPSRQLFLGFLRFSNSCK
jgi:hypothetical protein